MAILLFNQDWELLLASNKALSDGRIAKGGRRIVVFSDAIRTPSRPVDDAHTSTEDPRPRMILHGTSVSGKPTRRRIGRSAPRVPLVGQPAPTRQMLIGEERLWSLPRFLSSAPLVAPRSLAVGDVSTLDSTCYALSMRGEHRWEVLASFYVDGDVNAHGLSCVDATAVPSSHRLSGASVVRLGRAPDDALALLVSLTKLRGVELRGSAPSQAGYAHLEAMPALESLAFDSCSPNLAALARLPRLRQLRIDTLSKGAPVDALSQLSHLEVLHLSSATDADVDALTRRTGLRELCIASCSFSEAGLARLGALSELRALCLGEVRVPDPGWSFLAGLSGLRAFAAPQANPAYVYGFGDTALRALTAAPLEFLSLERVSVTDAGLPLLCEMPALKWVEILDADGITPEGAKALNLKAVRAAHVKIQAGDRVARSRKGEPPPSTPRDGGPLFWWETA